MWASYGAAEAQGEAIAAGVTTGWAFAGNIGSPSRAEYTVSREL